MSFIKCRSTKRIENIYLKYSDDLKILVFANQNEIEEAIYSKDKLTVFDVSQFIVENIKAKTSRKDLQKLIVENFGTTTRTVDERLKDIQSGIGINSLGFNLRNEKIGREKYYWVEKLPEQSEQEDFNFNDEKQI